MFKHGFWRCQFCDTFVVLVPYASGKTFVPYMSGKTFGVILPVLNFV